MAREIIVTDALKNIIREDIKYSFDWSYLTSITQIKKDIESMLEMGANNVSIEIIEDYGSSYLSFNCVRERLETDLECKRRLLKEKANRFDERARELKLLEELKKKYE